MERDAFEKVIHEGIEAIPEKFRAKLKNVAFVVEDEPSHEIRKREGLTAHQTLLGYYQGVPLTQRGDNYGIGPTLPDTITIYQRSIEMAAGNDPERIRVMVYETVRHEVAHYFGMNEVEVRAWEKSHH